MDVSKLEVGRYKAIFLDYLWKAEALCQCKELLERCDHLCDMQKVYGRKLITVLDYREEFLSLCDTLRRLYGFVADFDEAFSRVKTDYEIRKEEEEAAYKRLKTATCKCFGNASKVVRFCDNTRDTTNLRNLLIDDSDARARRDCFRRLLQREGDILSPVAMVTFFRDEIYGAYDNMSSDLA